MIIALNRCLREQLQDLQQGKFHILGYHQKLLSEQTVLIAGFGGIGQAVAEVLSPFHCRLTAISRHLPKSPLLDKAYTMDQLEEAVKEADVLVLALPFTKETEGLISRHILSLMKEDSLLVDVARAQLIDRAALLDKVKTIPASMWPWTYGGKKTKPTQRTAIPSSPIPMSSAAPIMQK